MILSSLSTHHHGQSIYQDSSEILNNGEILRIAVEESGVYKITGQWLFEKADIAPGSIPFNTIGLYSIFGGHLRHDSHYPDTERLQKLSIQIRDNGNGMFDTEDFLLFYAEGPNRLEYNSDQSAFTFEINPFSDEAYVFLKLDDDSGPTNIEPESENTFPTQLTPDFLYFAVHEEDRINLLDDFISGQGSGQMWVGENLTNQTELELSKLIDIPQDGIEDATLNVRVIGRSPVQGQISLSGNGFMEAIDFAPVNTTDIEALYARKVHLSASVTSLNPDQNILLQNIKNDMDNKVWLDQFNINGTARAVLRDEQLRLNNVIALNADDTSAGLSIAGPEEIKIWDITDPNAPIEKYIHHQDELRIIQTGLNRVEYYICFTPSQTMIPPAAEKIKPANVFQDGLPEMIIISPELFHESAMRLQEHRWDRQGLNCWIVRPDHVFNIYSAGKQDPTALRNYFRDVKRRYPEFKSVLLLGDASFDYRHINKSHPADNWVPTFETFNSLDPLLAFPSDDFYALLDDGENGNLSGDLDIAIGRLTVTSPREARDVINKIISYDRLPDEVEKWKTRVAFVADDEDNNLHINDADLIASELAESQPLFNQEKIYFDAFRQESTPGGNRYPQAAERLSHVVDNGALVINYLGHGGPNGWAQERVLKIDDINNWSNFDRLPLIVTATCSFTGFDDPSLLSAGEAALLKPNGGALSLFTTVRSVYASKNFQLTRSVFRRLFEQDNGRYLTIGEIMRRAKNDNPNDHTNARKFFLIGDPSIRLALPPLIVKTGTINGVDIKTSREDIRVSALDQVNLSGMITDSHGQNLDQYDGILDITVYDKPSQVRTFANDERSFVKNFESQQNIIYQGRTRITQGRFSTGFTVPLDIDFSMGIGKISYFAQSDSDGQAAGFTEQLVIGGPSINPVRDDTPPVIRAYLNDRSFLDGDLVPSSNKVIVDFSDDVGINISNAAIGHEIIAVLDEDRKNSIVLNDLVEGSLDDPKSGTIEFEITDLAPGLHELTVRMFDVANNPGETTIGFEVSNAIDRNIKEISNFPNPFGTYTIFDLSHELLDGAVLVEMDVFDLNGRFIENVTWQSVSRQGKMILEWRPILNADGVYLCHFTLLSDLTGESTESFVKKVVHLK